MPELMRLEHHEHYLHAEVTGPFDLENAQGFFATVVAECAKHGYAAVLIDSRRVTGDIPIVARYAFGRFVTTAQERPLRIALVGSPAHLHPNRSIETVVGEQGGAIKITTDMEDALLWLGA